MSTSTTEAPSWSMPRYGKCAFVTCGATAPFIALLNAVVTTSFLQILKKNDYNTLLVQYGAAEEEFMQLIKHVNLSLYNSGYERAEKEERNKALAQGRPPPNGDFQEVEGIRLVAFGFKEDGLKEEIGAAAADRPMSIGRWSDSEGVVISHAGTGTVLEVLRRGVPLIVVPNPELLDNHQDELAEELARQGYVVHGKLDALPEAIEAIEQQRRRPESKPPVNSGKPLSRRRLAKIMDEEAGFMNLD